VTSSAWCWCPAMAVAGAADPAAEVAGYEVAVYGAHRGGKVRAPHTGVRRADSRWSARRRWWRASHSPTVTDPAFSSRWGLPLDGSWWCSYGRGSSPLGETGSTRLRGLAPGRVVRQPAPGGVRGLAHPASGSLAIVRGSAGSSRLAAEPVSDQPGRFPRFPPPTGLGSIHVPRVDANRTRKESSWPNRHPAHSAGVRGGRILPGTDRRFGRCSRSAASSGKTLTIRIRRHLEASRV